MSLFVTTLRRGAIGSTAEAQTSVQGYFAGHPGEFLDLQRIVQPLKDVKNQCGVDISPSQSSSLFEALS